jgi:chromosome segregation ATPase
MQEKMGSKDKELTIVKKELAEMQVKLDRYETALKNSDRKIAELQGMLSDTKICLMSRAVTEGSEDTKTKSSSLRNVTQKLKRVFEGAQELKDCSSRATTQTATNQASSSLMEMSLGSFPKRYRKISNLSNVPLY